MRILNLILHIISALLITPDLLFVGIAFLWGVQYLKGLEIIIVPAFVFLIFASFFASLIAGTIQTVKYRSLRPKVYATRELLLHGLSASGFLTMIVYTLMIMWQYSFKIPEIGLYGSETSLSIFDLTGFAVSISGIIVNLLWAKLSKRVNAKAIANTPAIPKVDQHISRPGFCPNCGSPAGAAGNFCGNCGAGLSR